MPNLQIYGILAAIIIAAGLGFKVYFDYSQEQIKTLTSNMQVYKLKSEAEEKAFDTYKTNVATQLAGVKALAATVSKIETKSKEFDKMISRHELDKLASGNPAAIKRLANAATKKVFTNLEKASSAEETKQ